MIWTLFIVALLFVGLYFAYDRISWILAKRDEAKRSVIIIARHIKAFRHQIADKPNKGQLDEIFQDILIENARVAYVLGGVKLMYEVNDAKAFEKEYPKELENAEDFVEEVTEGETRNLQGI